MKEKFKFVLSTLIIVIGVAIPTYAVQIGGAGHDNGDYDLTQKSRQKEETGQVRILAGDTEVKVEFEKTYDDLPVVVLTPTNSLVDNLDYVVKDISNFGFTVEVDHSYQTDVDFSWHAFEVEEGKSYASDGSVEEIEVLMVEAEESEKVAGEANEAEERGEVMNEPDEGETTDGTIDNEDNTGAGDTGDIDEMDDTGSDSDVESIDGDDTEGETAQEGEEEEEGSGETGDTDEMDDADSDSDDGSTDVDDTGGEDDTEGETGDSGETDGAQLDAEPDGESIVTEEPPAEDPPTEELETPPEEDPVVE